MLDQFVSLLRDSSILAITPELLILIGAFLCLLLPLFCNKSSEDTLQKQRLIAIPFVGLALSFCVALLFGLDSQHNFFYFAGSFNISYFSVFFKGFIFLLLLILILQKINFKSEYFFLLLSATLGASVLVSSHDFILLFVALELMSLSAIALIAFNRHDKLSLEAGLKYLVSSAVASAFLLFAIGIIYGVSLSVNIFQLDQGVPQGIINTNFSVFIPQNGFPFYLFHLATLLIALVFAFKLSLFPFHNWTPDVYEGSNTPTTAFLSTISKVAAIGLLIRLFWTLFIRTSIPFLSPNELLQKSALSPADTPMGVMFLLLAIFAIASMWLGNMFGFRQVFKDSATASIKRILAFSAIAQTGYIISALLINPNIGMKAALYFLIAYNILNISAFIGLMRLERYISLLQIKTVKADSLESLHGLFQYRPYLAVFLGVIFAGLAGVFPTLLLPKILLANSLMSSTIATLFAPVFAFSAFLPAVFSLLLVLSLLLSSILAIVYYVGLIKHLFISDVPAEINQALPSANTAIKPDYTFRITASILLIVSLSMLIFPKLYLGSIATKVNDNVLNLLSQTSKVQKLEQKAK